MKDVLPRFGDRGRISYRTLPRIVTSFDQMLVERATDPFSRFELIEEEQKTPDFCYMLFCRYQREWLDGMDLLAAMFRLYRSDCRLRPLTISEFLFLLREISTTEINAITLSVYLVHFLRNKQFLKFPMPTQKSYLDKRYGENINEIVTQAKSILKFSENDTIDLLDYLQNSSYVLFCAESGSVLYNSKDYSIFSPFFNGN